MSTRSMVRCSDELCGLCLQLPSLGTPRINPSIDGRVWVAKEHGLVIQGSIVELEGSLLAFRTCIELPRLRARYCIGIRPNTSKSVDQFIDKLTNGRLFARCIVSAIYSKTTGHQKMKKYCLNALGGLPHIEFEYVDLEVSVGSLQPFGSHGHVPNIRS